MPEAPAHPPGLPAAPAVLPIGLVGGQDDDEHPNEHWPTCRKWIAESLETPDPDATAFLLHRARLRELYPLAVGGIERGEDVTGLLAQLRESSDIVTDSAGRADMSSSIDLAYRTSDLEQFAAWAREGRPPETVPSVRVPTVDERMQRIHPRRMSRAERRRRDEEQEAYWRKRAELKPQEDAESLVKYPMKEPVELIHPRYRVEAERAGSMGVTVRLLLDVHLIVHAGKVGEVSHAIAAAAECIPPTARCRHPFSGIKRDEIGFPKCGACEIRVTCSDEQEDLLDAQETAWLDAQDEGGEGAQPSTLPN
ncbi:MAG: hypothetical protein Q8P41_26875 [Pseudomonadota bacterium]|nr:hypothetical protein [Pseudomonadota bacterium]